MIRRLVLPLLAVALLMSFPAQAGTRLRPVPVLMYHVVSSPPAGAPYPDLYVPRGDFAALHGEVTGSREAIRRRFHVSVNFFCYLAGRYDDTVGAAVKAAGYLGATATRYGPARPGELYTLARIRVNGTDGARGLAAKLEAVQP